MNKKLKRIIFPSIYLLALGIIVICIYIVGESMSNYLEKNKEVDYTKKEVFEQKEPVMAEETKIIKPYKDENVKIGKTFYDYQADATEQEKSIIFYENTYMQNSGVDYTNDKDFEVISVLDGEVIDVKTDKVLGNIVEIKHENDLITVYQGLGKVNVKKEDKVVQGQSLGLSGTTELNPDYKSYLHFEVFHKGELLNPESLYNLNLEELGKEQ